MKKTNHSHPEKNENTDNPETVFDNSNFIKKLEIQNLVLKKIVHAKGGNNKSGHESVK